MPEEGMATVMNTDLVDTMQYIEIQYYTALSVYIMCTQTWHPLKPEEGDGN